MPRPGTSPDKSSRHNSLYEPCRCKWQDGESFNFRVGIPSAGSSSVKVHIMSYIWERANGEPPGLGPGDSDFEYHLPDQI